MQVPSRFLRGPWLVVAALLLVSCGGGDPLGPSGNANGEITLRGTVLGSASSASLGVRALSAGAGPLIVSVLGNPALSAPVGSDGSFTLRGLPTGTVVLVFTRDGSPVGSLTLDNVRAGQEITITVSVTTTGVALVDDRRNGIGHGDLEMEGLVQSVLPSPVGETRFLIDGRTVVVRPGQTAIREGNNSLGVNAVTPGRRVHVKGTYLPMEGTTQPVLALEIKLQGSGSGNPPSGGGPSNACMINGARVGDRLELEGDVASGGAAGFVLRVQGNRASGPVRVDAAGAEFQCTPRSGPNAPTPAQCRDSVRGGAKVHVSGMLATCDTADALVRANTVQVQK